VRGIKPTCAAPRVRARADAPAVESAAPVLDDGQQSRL
jgi:hypothetical protein